MKVWWRELRTVSVVAALTAGVVAAFPLSALDFKARPVAASREASAAFVSLSADEETMALKAARSAWQSEASATQRMRVRLPLGELPEEEAVAPLDLSAEQSFVRVRLPQTDYPLPAAVPSMAAEPPQRLAPEPEVPAAPPFSRNDLLDLN